MNKTNMIILIYFLSIAVYGIAEIILQLWFSKWKFNRIDKSLIPIMIPFYLSIYLAPVENILVQKNLSYILIMTGFSILLVGVIIRISSLLTLKQNFSLAIESDTTNFIVAKGLYKYIRHPLYLAVLVISMSGCIIFSCIIIWIFVILTLIGVIRRIKEEEALLILNHKEYKEYMKKTFKLVPFIY
jgi:protein-S-isoprenylcysteine O-methyltransferase Ste14